MEFLKKNFFFVSNDPLGRSVLYVIQKTLQLLLITENTHNKQIIKEKD